METVVVRVSLGVFSHPLGGTCVPGCPMYGLCHHCGQPAKIADKSSSRARDTAGHPRVFLHGHSPGSRTAGAFTRRGVTRLQLAPLLRWLASRYGVDGTVELLGLPRGTVHGIMYRRRKKYVSPEIAERVIQVVLAHRKPLSIFDQDVHRRFPLSGEIGMRRDPVRRPACGTRTGYKIHRHHDEQPCDDCLDAHRDAKRAEASA